jgi:hypothetical protein
MIEKIDKYHVMATRAVRVAGAAARNSFTTMLVGTSAAGPSQAAEDEEI